jgi:regulatory protein
VPKQKLAELIADLGLDESPRSSSSSPGTDDGEEAYKGAVERAGRFLAARPHSEHELRAKLEPLDPEVMERVMERLAEWRLLNDEAFARQWVAERSVKKGERALRHELVAKGIPGHIIEEVMAEAEESELTRATALAAGYVRRVASKPLERQAGAICQMLVRRGFSYDLAREATTAVLPPEGWD